MGNNLKQRDTPVRKHQRCPDKQIAAETLRYTQKVCTERDLSFLRNLPTHREVAVNSTSFYRVYSSPTDPLFGYLRYTNYPPLVQIIGQIKIKGTY
jgi:hypothetical protein